MSNSFKICSVAIQLFAIVHLVQSYVLITANVEDLKKIARKFIPDSLAEQLADYILRATNANINSELSNENRAQKEDDNEYFQPVKPNKSKNRNTNVITTKSPTTKKSRFKIADKSTRSNTKDKHPKTNHPVRQYMYSVNEPQKYDKDRDYEKGKKRPKHQMKEDEGSDESAAPIKHKPQSRQKYEDATENKKLTEFSSNISKYVDHKIKDKKSTKDDTGELDQYENTNYLKQDLLATSGPVSLPKFNIQKWFDTSLKDQESDNN